MKFQVQVSATSANMGPGFDCLGMALELFNLLTVEEASSFAIEIKGEGQGILPRDKRNLVYKAMDKLCIRLGRQVPAIKIYCENKIPLARGLGSSAAAVVGGLMAANYLLGSALSKEDILPLAIEMEGHGDNVAPAIFGGCQIVLKDEERFKHFPVPFPSNLKAVLFIPDLPISTAASKKILPAQVSHAEAVYNIGRIALLIQSLNTGQLEPLTIATQDRLHQPARKALFPAMDMLFQKALGAGAADVFLSGSGSTVLALSADEGSAHGIAKAMAKAASEEKISGRSKIVGFASQGARID